MPLPLYTRNERNDEEKKIHLAFQTCDRQPFVFNTIKPSHETFTIILHHRILKVTTI